VPFSVAVFYPNLGSLVGILGSYAGFFIVYVLPISVFWKSMQTKVELPLLASALENKEWSFSDQSSVVSPYLRLKEFMNNDKKKGESD
jgi:hypothetical protein